LAWAMAALVAMSRHNSHSNCVGFGRSFVSRI
jgi:hypothetical protein